MEFHHNQVPHSPSSISSSSSSVSHNNNSNNNHQDDPMHSWWESVSKARSRILSLSSLLPASSSAAATVSSIADSDRPGRSLLASSAAYSAISAALSSPLSGSGSDPLCQWLYDTFQSSHDPDLRLVVLSLIPLLSALYLSRLLLLSSTHPSSPRSDDHHGGMPSLAGFEAVLLSLYASETKARAGKPVLINIPDLSQPSLYHAPLPRHKQHPAPPSAQSGPFVGVVSEPLEPQIAVKSTKRACIVGVALDCYYKQISKLPTWSKLEFCRFASVWAGQDCSCKSEFDHDEIDGFSEAYGDIDSLVEEMENFGIKEDNHLPQGARRIPLPWELFQPILKILGHCLLAPLNPQDVKDAASVAVRCLYARASHDLVPQAILATRSLIKLGIRARAAAMTAAANASNANTPSKAKKPEILLVSK